MQCMVVTAHPLPASLCMALADQAVTQLQTTGHDVVLEDLYVETGHLIPILRLPCFAPEYLGAQTLL